MQEGERKTPPAAFSPASRGSPRRNAPFLVERKPKSTEKITLRHTLLPTIPFFAFLIIFLIKKRILAAAAQEPADCPRVGRLCGSLDYAFTSTADREVSLDDRAAPVDMRPRQHALS